MRRLLESGWEVVRIENDMRAQFFGPEASAARVTEEQVASYPDFRPIDPDDGWWPSVKLLHNRAIDACERIADRKLEWGLS